MTATVTPSTVLLSGASAGIGRATALRLAAGGHQVFAGVRTDAQAQQLLVEAQGELTPLLLDVTQPDTIEQAVERLAAERTCERVALVNNAGYSLGGPLEVLPVDAVRGQFEVNVFGLLALTQRVIPLLRATHGRLVMVSSVVGRVTPPFIGAYSASKRAVEAFADALRVELAPWGVRVVVVQPGRIATAFQQTALTQFAALPPAAQVEARSHYGPVLDALTQDAAHASGAPPELVAATIQQALEEPAPAPRLLVGVDEPQQLAFERLSDSERDAHYRAGLPGWGDTEEVA